MPRAVRAFFGCCRSCFWPMAGAARRGRVVWCAVHKVRFLWLRIDFWRAKSVFGVYAFSSLRSSASLSRIATEVFALVLGGSSAPLIPRFHAVLGTLPRVFGGSSRARAGASRRALMARAGQGIGRFSLRIVRGGAGWGRGKCEERAKKNGKTFGRSREKA